MSYRCDNCQQHGEGAPLQRVTERREKEYKAPEGRVSHGHEIVKEMKLCQVCEKIVPEAPIPFGVFETTA